jgi:hypothetical protein
MTRFVSRPVTRTIILHYHLFKNAGTSLDLVLKRNFGARWVTAEFPNEGLVRNTEQVADWIRANPDAVAFSSHTAQGPIPQIDGVRIVSVMFLRDPIARIRSAYQFERDQGADTWGAELAAANDFAGYVSARLARPGDRQCRNFQTCRMAMLAPPLPDMGPKPGPDSELARAFRGLATLACVGLVDEFDRSVARLARLVQVEYPGFRWTSVRANATTYKAVAVPGADAGSGHGVTLEAALQALQVANRDDQALLERAQALYGAQVSPHSVVWHGSS